ncbi:flavin reductase family protein [Mesorhizobium silamurunense]|uniref:flavin reductase family protein n=1 Tax=Mesorhizobium silamurunense TaxID=499528 RepID=UPI001782D0A6|nr:iron-sulfur cluster-binding domain-containing protein [Mesorhizobium silamurunense]
MNANAPPVNTEQRSRAVHPCICTDRIRETGDVATLMFRRVDGRKFDFLAGQFVTIRFSWGGQTCSRVFTISSPPTRPDRITLTIKAAVDGKATRILHDHFGEGTMVEIGDAAGDFTLEGRAVEKALFLCAGSGITPLMSMLRALHDQGRDLDVTFIQCARTPDDILFGNELQTLSRNMPRLKVETVCSRASGSDDNGRAGRLDITRLASLVPDVGSRTVFLCGPSSFMQAMRGHLIELGVPTGLIFSEAFGGDPSTRTVPPGTTTIVAFERSGVRREARESATILETAEAAGVYVDTSCRMGVCGTCKVRLLNGEVDLNDMGGLSDLERQDGLILACCSTPRGDVTVDL